MKMKWIEDKYHSPCHQEISIQNRYERNKFEVDKTKGKKQNNKNACVLCNAILIFNIVILSFHFFFLIKSSNPLINVSGCAGFPGT